MSIAEVYRDPDGGVSVGHTSLLESEDISEVRVACLQSLDASRVDSVAETEPGKYVLVPRSTPGPRVLRAEAAYNATRTWVQVRHGRIIPPWEWLDDASRAALARLATRITRGYGPYLAFETVLSPERREVAHWLTPENKGTLKAMLGVFAACVKQDR